MKLITTKGLEITVPNSHIEQIRTNLKDGRKDMFERTAICQTIDGNYLWYEDEGVFIDLTSISVEALITELKNEHAQTKNT